MIDDYTIKRIDYDIKMCTLMYKVYSGIELNNDEIKEFEKFSENADNLLSLFVGMHSRYSLLISDFPTDINIENLDFDDEVMEFKIVQYFKNITEKLNAFKRMGYNEMKKNDLPNIVIHNENKNHNENNISNILLSFQDAKQEIENMSALTDEEIEEILNKIEEIEGIVNSTNRKSKKWENAKGIIKWVADKSFDVAKIIIPLVLKIE